MVGFSLYYFSEGEKRRPEIRLLFAGYTEHNCSRNWEVVQEPLNELLRLNQKSDHSVGKELLNVFCIIQRLNHTLTHIHTNFEFKIINK